MNKDDYMTALVIIFIFIMTVIGTFSVLNAAHNFFQHQHILKIQIQTK